MWGCGRPACRSRPPPAAGRRRRWQAPTAMRAHRRLTTAHREALHPPPQRTAASPTSLKVMTVNTHKGFTALQPQVHPARAARSGAHGRRRRGVPAGGAGHALAPRRAGSTTGPRRRTTSSWPTRSGRSSPTAATRSIRRGHHGNAVLSKFPIVHYKNHDVSIAGPEKRGLLHCVLRLPGRADRRARDLRAPGPGRERTGSSSSSCCATSCATRCRPTRR